MPEGVEALGREAHASGLAWERAPLPDIPSELSSLLREAPENQLADYPGQHIFDGPAIGVADGDDPLFLEFRRVVGSGHFLPRELLERHCPDAVCSCVRVVSWALPFAEGVRRSNRVSGYPSRLYSLARNNSRM